jgi:hypothetical protein
MKLKSIFLLTLVLFTLKLFTQDYEVSPVKLYFTTDPGSVQVKTITIKNHGNTTQSFLLTLGDFIINSNGQIEYGAVGSNKRSISDWITINPTFFDIRPNEEQIISISIQPPVDEFGSRWGVIFVRAATERMSFDADKTFSAGINLNSRIMVEIFQTPMISTGIISVKIDQLREIDSEPTKRKFTALVTNNSDVIVNGKVYLIASNMETGKETIFPSINVNMFPKNTQRVNFEIPNNLPTGFYALAAILDYGSYQALEGVQIVIESR